MSGVHITQIAYNNMYNIEDILSNDIKSLIGTENVSQKQFNSIFSYSI